MSKEELIKEKAHLEDRILELHNRLQSINNELDAVTESRDYFQREFERARNKIHFLAGMLVKEWVCVSELLDVQVYLKQDTPCESN